MNIYLRVTLLSLQFENFVRKLIKHCVMKISVFLFFAQNAPGRTEWEHMGQQFNKNVGKNPANFCHGIIESVSFSKF